MSCCAHQLHEHCWNPGLKTWQCQGLVGERPHYHTCECRADQMVCARCRAKSFDLFCPSCKEMVDIETRAWRRGLR